MVNIIVTYHILVNIGNFLLKYLKLQMSRCFFNRKFLENQKVAKKMKSCRIDAEHLVANLNGRGTSFF